MRHILLILMMISVLISCTKFGRTDTAKGRVLNPVTGEGIAGVEMKLLKTTSGIPGGNKAVKSTTTDANGSYEISKAGLKSYSLSCNLSTDYYPIGWFVDGEIKNTNTGNYSLKKGKTLHADFYAVPYGSLQRHIKNNSCFDTNDEIKIYFDGGDYESSTYQVGLLTTLPGCIDITTNPVQISSGNKYFHWVVTKNNISTTYYDTVFVSSSGTTQMDIFY